MTFEFGRRRSSRRRSSRRSRRSRRSRTTKVRVSRRRSRRSGRKRGNPDAKAAMNIAVEMAKKSGKRPANHLKEAWAQVKGGGKRRTRRSRGKKAFGVQVIPGF